MTIAGKPTPHGTSEPKITSCSIFLTMREIDAITAAGADGWGVGTRWRGEIELAGVEVDEPPP